MSAIDTYELKHSGVFSIYSDRDEIKTDPEYQRHGGVWTLEKKQLLIDSLINQYDIPKIYFHRLPRQSSADGGQLKYAVIDGRQRLEAIWEFLEGKYKLSDDIVYLNDPNKILKGLTYSDLTTEFPVIKNRFDATHLPIIVVDTNDLELIEDMFSRLNEAVPLNAAERRNAIGGNIVRAVNEVSQLKFFKKKVRFTNKRYQHREVSIRLLFLEYCVSGTGKVIDTKKPYLDDFAKRFKKAKKTDVVSWKKQVTEILSQLTSVFIDNDNLLQAQASVPVYYLVARSLLIDGDFEIITRRKLEQFNAVRVENRKLAENDIAKADFDLLEFDRLSQQGTNDASSIKERTQTLMEFLRR